MIVFRLAKNSQRRKKLKATDIPFVNTVGIQEERDKLFLDFKDDILNHIKTIHASAQFTLAETESGIYLQTLFPELKGKVLPVLRDAHIKYKKTATQKIIAYSSSDKEVVEKFKNQFDKKGRGTIKVDVEIRDINDIVTSYATFTWFIQAL